MSKATIPGITTIAVSATTTVPVERVLAVASDFTPRRGHVFPAVSAKHTTVHAIAGTSADVTEGTRVGPLVIWERCDYDWSEPGRVTATVTDSNVYATPGSSWTITAEPAHGATRVEMTWRRGFRRRPLGRFMGFMYRTVGQRSFTKYARDTLHNLETIDDHTIL